MNLNEGHFIYPKFGFSILCPRRLPFQTNIYMHTLLLRGTQTYRVIVATTSQFDTLRKNSIFFKFQIQPFWISRTCTSLGGYDVVVSKTSCDIKISQHGQNSEKCANHSKICWHWNTLTDGCRHCLIKSQTHRLYMYCLSTWG